MILLWIVLLGAGLGAHSASAASSGATNAASVASGQDPKAFLEQEYTALQSEDDAAQAEVDKWIRENKEADSKGDKQSAELQERIQKRFEPVRKDYEALVRRHQRKF